MSTIYKRGKSWYINWSENGRQHRKSLGRITKLQAQKVQTALITQLLTGSTNATPSPTLRQYADEYLLWHQAEYPDSHQRIRQIVSQYLLPAFGETPIDRISLVEIDDWKSSRAASNGTIRKEIRTLKAMLNKAVAWDIIKEHRIKHASHPKSKNSREIVYYTPEQLQKLYQTASEPHLWQFMANTGVRRGEALNARREHIRGNSLFVESTQERRTKSGKWREIPLSPGAKEALEHLGADYLAPRVIPNSLTRMFKKDAERAGLPGSLHCLRHTFVSLLVMKGIDLVTVQKLAGHAEMITTLKYAHLNDDHLRNAVAGLDV